MSSPSAFLVSPPDPASRQPFTFAAILPLILLYYVLAVLTILPHTFILKLALLPTILCQAWKCAVGLDFSLGLASSMGLESPPAGLCQWNNIFVCGLFDMALRSVAWTFAKRPLRRYNTPPEGQHVAPVERPLSIPNVLLDSLDLICNLRGIGWSWSHKSFPKTNTLSTSIPVILAKLLIKFVALDASHYLMQHSLYSVDGPAVDTIFDPTLSMVPCCAWAAFSTICGAVVVYTTLDVLYHIATLIGRILLRQSAWQWPPIFNRPWMSTSITELWGFRWHQMLRYVFVTFGSRPAGALLGRAGALMGAFAMSAVLHNLSMWGVGRGTEFRTVGGFFLLMGVGAALEHGFKVVTGHRVGGIWGWMWTMVWTTVWGTFLIDAWVRRGMCETDPVADRDGSRPGKLLVDAIISLSPKEFDVQLMYYS